MATILIVDDDEARYIAVKPRLERVNHEVTIARDRNEAECVLINSRYHLLWIDINMPDAEDKDRAGIILIQKVRGGLFGDWGRDVPILIPTGFPSTFMRSEQSDDPNITLLPIPIPAATLCGTIQNILSAID